jgi:hypothetical protein
MQGTSRTWGEPGMQSGVWQTAVGGTGLKGRYQLIGKGCSGIERPFKMGFKSVFEKLQSNRYNRSQLERTRASMS